MTTATDGKFTADEWNTAARHYENLPSLMRRAYEEELTAALLMGQPPSNAREAARLAFGLAQATVREPVFYRLLVGLTEADHKILADKAARYSTLTRARTALEALADMCPNYALAPVAASLAMMAWQQGYRGFARDAAHRATEADPTNSLGQLVKMGLLSGSPKTHWITVLRAFGLDALRSGDPNPAHPELLK